MAGVSLATIETFGFESVSKVFRCLVVNRYCSVVSPPEPFRKGCLKSLCTAMNCCHEKHQEAQDALLPGFLCLFVLFRGVVPAPRATDQFWSPVQFSDLGGRFQQRYLAVGSVESKLAVCSCSLISGLTWLGRLFVYTPITGAVLWAGR